MKKEFPYLLTDDKEEANVILTGIPFGKNVSIGGGAEKAPSHIRELSVMYPPMTQFGEAITNIKLYDNGDILTEDFSEMQSLAFKALKENKFNVFLGGDHSIAIATERAFYDYAKGLGKTPVIIHLDAHPDICDIYENNYYSHACPNKRSLDYGYPDDSLTMIGMRCFEPQEVEFLNNHPDILCIKANEAKKLGADGIIAILKKKYSDNQYLIHFSYDIDVNDPAFAPGTGTPEPWGLSSELVLDLILGAFKELNIYSLDLVEISPLLDLNDITSSLAIKTLYEIFYIIGKKWVK